MYLAQNTNSSKMQYWNVKNVNIWKVEISKWWKLTTPLWSCVAFVWVVWDIWFMGHVFDPKEAPNMINETRKKLRELWINLDNCNIYIAWWACSEICTNPIFRIWDKNLEAMKKLFWKRVRQICVWWNDSRLVTLDITDKKFTVEKIAKWGLSKYLSRMCKIN